MTYLPRFVIRECHGYDMRYPSRASRHSEAPLASLVVLDRPYCFAKVAEFYLDEIPAGGGAGYWDQARRFRELYDRAETYCAELNARVADAQVNSRLRSASLLSPGADHSSLSPFDSGCPR